MKEKPITIVFVAPSKTRNPSLSVLDMVFPIIAACPLPKPGSRLDNGDAINAPNKGDNNFPFIFGLEIFCLGTTVLFFILRASIEDPKRPVRRGSNGSLTSRFKTLKPRIPVRKKTKRAGNLFFSSIIKMIETTINK